MIRVSIFRRSDRNRSKNWQMQYRDPRTGRKVTRSAGTTIRRDAERAAAKWEAELRAGHDPHRDGRLPFESFVELYQEHCLDGLASKTASKACGVLATYERSMNPRTLRDVTELSISGYVAALRDGGRSETTIKGHLAHLRAALRWAQQHGLIAKTPQFRMPARSRKGKMAKGRPITTEEFERMLAVIPDALFSKDSTTPHDRRPAIVASWRFYLRGLWWSGLRLDESLNLHWTDRSLLRVESLDSRQPMLWIPGDLEKGHQDRMLPMAPEFAEFLRQVPKADRDGFVFDPQPRRHRYGDRLSPHRVSRIISAVGERANVVVSETGGRRKYASAHDLRRSFGDRWATRVMPPILQELMRHASIQTTLSYYVGTNAARSSAILWDAFRQFQADTAMSAPDAGLGGVLGGRSSSADLSDDANE